MAKQKPHDPGGRHIRVYASLLNAPAFRVLGFAAKALFLDLRERITATNNGNIAAPISEMKHKGWNSSATLSRALYELRATGFVSVTRDGGLKMGTRVPTLYRFTDLPVLEHPKLGIQATGATHDYQLLASVADAKRALRDGVRLMREEGRNKQAARKKPPVQILNRTSSHSELEGAFTSSHSEQGESVPVHILNRENSTTNPSKSLMDKGFHSDARQDTGLCSPCSDSEHPLYITNVDGVADAALVAKPTADHTLPAVEKFQERIGSKLYTPPRDHSLGRTRQIRLFKAAFAHLFAPPILVNH